MGAIRELQIKEYLEAPHKVGDWVVVDRDAFKKYVDSNQVGEIVSINADGTITIKDTYGKIQETVEEKYVRKWTRKVGANPFAPRSWRAKLDIVATNLGSVLHCAGYNREGSVRSDYKRNGIEVPELNWKPYVFDKEGNKQYYQRDFVWTLKDEQLLVESIYNFINCGMIIVRERSWDYIYKTCDNGDAEVAFKDIVDGKQRLHTIWRFVTDQFKDLHGNYFSDLSAEAQYEFRNSRSITLARLSEESTDDDVLSTFLKVNFAGVPMSQEHIDFVSNIYNKIR